MNVTAIPPALQSATSTIQRSQAGFDRDAAVVAQPDAIDSADMIGALVDSRQQLLYTAAAAKLISTSDDMMASLLDVHA